MHESNFLLQTTTMSRVSDIMKMYQQPTTNGTRPVVAGKKWPPVSTNVGGSTAQFPKPTPKPKPVPSALHGGTRNSSHQNNDNMPAWKRELMKAKEQTNAQKPAEVVNSKSLPTVKPGAPVITLANRKAFQNKIEERVKPWQPNRRDSASSNDSVASEKNAIKKNPPSLPNKPKPPPLTEKPKSSFLHSPARNANPTPADEFPPPPLIPPLFSSGPRRREIPTHVYERPPPTKQYRPPGVNINSFLHNNKSPRHSLHELPPPLPGVSYHPAHRPALPTPDKPQQSPLPQPPIPSPAIPLAQRPLPPPNLPPPIEDDDDELYDLPPQENPPPPSPALPPRPSNQIPTCDDSEDEGGAVYDETAPDLLQAGLHPPNDPEQYVAGDGEIYESVEEYMKFKGQTQKVDDIPNNEKQKKLEEKRRKDSEKKEKKMRKEFNLAKDIDIIAEAQGIVNSDARGRGKDLSVTHQEKVEVIRMANNPKGKWLVRNQQGIYGYVESNNVTIDVGILKTTMHHGPQTIIPTMDEDEEEGAIYDETDAVGFDDDDDLYEEFDN